MLRDAKSKRHPRGGTCELRGCWQQINVAVRQALPHHGRSFWPQRDTAHDTNMQAGDTGRRTKRSAVLACQRVSVFERDMIVPTPSVSADLPLRPQPETF